jgi:hypothetical protein
MHKTSAGERRKDLLKKAHELEREAKFLAKGKKPKLATEAREEAEKLKSQAEALKTQARLEDLTVRVAEKIKTTKKGSKSYTYWMASWREGGKVHNVHLGSCRKISEEEALQKAREMKAAWLGQEKKSD